MCWRIYVNFLQGFGRRIEDYKSRSKTCMDLVGIGVQGEGRGSCRAPTWKISKANSVSGQAQVAQKSWMIKNISIQWKNFKGKWKIAQKSWMIKILYFSEKFQGNYVFQVKLKLLTILNEKKFLFNTVKSGPILFSRESASCSNILNGKILQLYFFMGFQITFKKIHQALFKKAPITIFSKTFKKPKHESDSTCQLPPKKPNVEKKKPNSFFWRQLPLKKAKFTKFGVKKANLATLWAGYGLSFCTSLWRHNK